jgi:hypothetical protein
VIVTTLPAAVEVAVQFENPPVRPMVGVAELNENAPGGPGEKLTVIVFPATRAPLPDVLKETV